MRIFLDDLRDAPLFDHFGVPVQWTVIRNVDEAIELVRSGQVTAISFDHDLGEGKTGYDVALVIEQLAHDRLIPPIDYYIHSANPVGAGNINEAMKSAWRFWERNWIKFDKLE